MKQQNMFTRMICTFVFTLFTFYYLYDYQADLLTVMQHVFSRGQTHYNHFVGAVLITVVLLLLQIGVVNICRRMRLAWALTFFPSAVCLAMLTNVHLSPMDGRLVFGSWAYVGPFAIVLFAVCVWAANKSGLAKAMSDGLTQDIRRLWLNLLWMALMALMVCGVGNGDRDYHTRIHVEQCLLDKDYDGALDAIRQSGAADSTLTMLAAYTLSRKGMLPERLFEYPLVGGAHALMPDGRNIRFEIYPKRDYYLYLGGNFKQQMSSGRYVDYRLRHGRLNKGMADYALCYYLLDRNLDAFVVNLRKYYEVNDSTALPRHYREALILYNHRRSNPLLVYDDNVMEADFQDYQKMQGAYSDERERKTALRDTYGNTYWFYYDN